MKTFTLSAAASSLAATLLVLGSSVAPVAAQSTTTTTTAANTTSIPTGISATCSTFLSSLNSDSQLDACTKPLLAATKYYSSNTTDTSAQLDSTLTELCSSNTGCDANIIRQRLDQFWQNCHTDLQSKNDQVQAMYDNLYMITPLVNSICSKDENSDYCLKTIAKAAATSQHVARRALPVDDEDEEDDDEDEASETVAQLERRQSENINGISNQTESTARANTNAAFLFISSSSPKSILCSRCTQNILASYIKFETSIPYAIGLRTSEILAPQSDIYKAAKTNCGLDFVGQVNKIANTTQFAAVVSGAQGQAVKGLGMLVTLVAGAVVAAVAL